MQTLFLTFLKDLPCVRCWGHSEASDKHLASRGSVLPHFTNFTGIFKKSFSRFHTLWIELNLLITECPPEQCFPCLQEPLLLERASLHSAVLSPRVLCSRSPVPRSSRQWLCPSQTSFLPCRAPSTAFVAESNGTFFPRQCSPLLSLCLHFLAVSALISSGSRGSVCYVLFKQLDSSHKMK